MMELVSLTLNNIYGIGTTFPTAATTAATAATTAKVFSSDIGITFGLAKWGHLIVNRGKKKSTSEISLPDDQIYDSNENYKFFRILQLLANNDKEIRCTAISEYKNRVRRVIKSKLSSPNYWVAIHTFAVSVIDTQRL